MKVFESFWKCIFNNSFKYFYEVKEKTIKLILQNNLSNKIIKHFYLCMFSTSDVDKCQILHFPYSQMINQHFYSDYLDKLQNLLNLQEFIWQFHWNGNSNDFIEPKIKNSSGGMWRQPRCDICPVVAGKIPQCQFCVTWKMWERGKHMSVFYKDLFYSDNRFWVEISNYLAYNLY